MPKIEWPPKSGKYIEYNIEGLHHNSSETSRCRDRLKNFCVGNGIDVGYGGDAITKEAITIDLPQPYGAPGWIAEHPDPQHLKGDGINLEWFKDSCLDYVYSSHLLEDFDKPMSMFILYNWLRVLKDGGLLILYLPDQHRYEEYCKAHKAVSNPNHKIKDFGLKYFKNLIKRINYFYLTIEYERDNCEDYSFEIVMKKQIRKE